MIALTVASAVACSAQHTDTAKQAAPVCAVYVAQVSNAGIGTLDVFALAADAADDSGGVFVGTVGPNGSQRFTLPHGSSRVRLQRDDGRMPSGSSSQARITCGDA